MLNNNRGDSTQYADPYEAIAGDTEVEWQRGVAASDHFDESDPGFCPHTPETITLDEPAFIDDRGKIHLPGRPVECPECGNPYEFRVNGQGVFFQ